MNDVTIQNPFKRTDVFQCQHPSHRKFNYKVSAHHVLNEKNCYPDGCLYFEWHCSLMEKGNRCIHGYQYVGRKCKGCTHYLDEKFHFQPTCLLSDIELKVFEEQKERFSAWLEEVKWKRFSCAGRILSVKPWFESHYTHHQKKQIFKGYLLVFKNGFIGRSLFDGPFYVRVSHALMQQHRFLPKMKLEFTSEVRYDMGRIVLFFPKGIEIFNRGWGYHWTKSKALVALKTGTIFQNQPEGCLSCTWSLLIDVLDDRDGQIIKKRELHCMKGVTDSQLCTYAVFKRVRKKLKKNGPLKTKATTPAPFL